MNEKKQKILITAMKLFSKSSFHQTSMQQIADVCGVSKGSLYTHFKSKDELLSEIFTYYYHLLNHLIAASETDTESSQEAFIRSTSIRIRHYCQFQEFFQMQMNEIKGLDDPSLNQFVQQENAKLHLKTENDIISVFGPDIKPYALDLTAMVYGLLTAYIRIIVEDNKLCDFQRLADFLFQQLNAVAQMYLQKKPKPFLVTSPWQVHLKNDVENMAHPLQTIRKLKEKVAKEEAIAIESVEVLEKELMKIKPRAAVLSGMIRNLKDYPILKELITELETTIHIMSFHTTR